MPEPSSDQVEVTLLGGLRLVCAHAALKGEDLGRRAELALARLALENGSSVSRDVLADAVWGSAPPLSWRESLRNVITEIRRALAGTGLDACVKLTSADSRYRLELPAGSSVDLIRLRASTQGAAELLHAGKSQEALDLAEQALAAANGELLPGGGEEWVEGLRDEASDLTARLELIAGESALAIGDPGRAEALGWRLVARLPLREDGHRLLISALHQAGRNGEALLAFDRCRRTLRETLGAQPAVATEALYLQILSEEAVKQPIGRPGLAAAPVAGPLALLHAGTPFVGRAELCQTLMERARLASDAGVFITCVCGEPGIGKTRLAAELAAGCHAAGMSVLYGRAEDRVGVPYASLIEALERALGGISTGVALQSDRVADAIIELLQTVTGQPGGLLVLDDMQWASQAELDVLLELLADPQATRLLVLVLHRHGDDPAALTSVGAHPRVARQEVGPLELEEVAELTEVLDGDPAGSFSGGRARQVWRASGGNPLLASELLHTTISEAGGRVGSLVGRLVDERLSRLSDGAARTLRLAAIAGLEFKPEVVTAAAAAAAEDPGSVATQLEAARSVGLLVDSGDGRRAFRHGLVREALLDKVDEGERARLHVQLGEWLERSKPTSQGGLADLAYHFAAAGPLGGPGRSLQYALPVARQAYESGVYEDVIVLATRALEATGPVSDARLDLEILLGGAQRALGDHRGQETLTRAFEHARERGDAIRMADAALAVAPTGAITEAAYLDELTQRWYEEALAALEPVAQAQAGRRAQLLARLAAGLSWRQSLRFGQPFVTEAEALARQLGEPRTIATVLATVRRSLAGSSDLELMRRVEDELLALGDELSDPELQTSAALWRFGSSIQRGRGDALETLLEQAGTHARGLRMANLHHAIAWEHASLALLRGRLGEAEMLVERAAQIGRDRGLDEIVVEAIRVTQMLLVRGEQHRLGEMLEQVEPLFEHSGVPAWRATVAIINVARGVTDGAAELLDAVLDQYRQLGPSVLCPVAVIAYLTPTALALGDPDRVRLVRDFIAPAAGQGAYLAGFAGPIDYHLGLLDRWLGRDQDAAAALQRAASFCERLGAPRWKSRCEEALRELSSLSRRVPGARRSNRPVRR